LRRLVGLLSPLCTLALIMYAASGSLRAETKVRKDRTVVVISLDGFPAYALDDPKLPIPTLRKLAKQGVVAASMMPVNPTVTWPNHTAIVTGVPPAEHQVLFNGLLIRPENGAKPVIEMWRDKDQMVHSPTIYDVAYAAGLTTAQVDWVAIYKPKTITWQFPEIPDPSGAIEGELMDAGVVTAEQLRAYEDSSQAWQDEIWTAAAEDIIEKHRPNLLLFHLLTLDNTNHAYGPMTPGSFTAMALLDANVKRIVEALDRSGLTKNTTLMIVSDHGFRSYKNKIHPNVLLREKGLVTGTADQAKGEAWVVPEGGTAMVYVTNPDRKSQLVRDLRRNLSAIEGVDQIYGTEDFANLGLPLPAASDQAPDLFLTAKPDYMFSGESDGELVSRVPEVGTHGYINSDPKMQAIFIASGVGVPKGVRLDSISNLDVAPTIAALLGLEMKNVKGHAIQQIVNFNSDRRSQAAKPAN